MDVDPAPTQKENMPESTNGVNGNADKMDVDVDEEAPIPPRHKSPVEKPVPTAEDAEAFKNMGNVHYKAREYGKAIAEYTKGTRDILPQWITWG